MCIRRLKLNVLQEILTSNRITVRAVGVAEWRYPLLVKRLTDGPGHTRRLNVILSKWLEMFVQTVTFYLAKLLWLLLYRKEACATAMKF
jgi:hypothetical protein